MTLSVESSVTWYIVQVRGRVQLWAVLAPNVLFAFLYSFKVNISELRMSYWLERSF